MNVETDPLAILRHYWGYDSFRSLQERIIRSLLAGQDTCVVMPTGGGKSLCYQLPAVVLGKTTVVISPLIALMQDQAAQLAQMGIPAAVLNSTLSGTEQSRVMRAAREGAYRLLYLSPERLARPDTSEWLAQVPVSFFAIDEAHCISEWGHEFRPEYRQLSRLRARFPDRPIAAFTASATRRVRHDILQQLQLRDPHKYIASFHRTNLRYVVKETDAGAQAQFLIRALRHLGDGNAIVYAPTIARVERTVDMLQEEGVAAVAYHGQMETGQRRRNQERWMSDEVRVLVGTIAFGLGINKSSVRAVIHLSLPKSLEQYYQEAGRAGRDGRPADCLLLWQRRDTGLLAHFIDQVTDPAEKERAWQRYRDIRDFVESGRCRHRQVCRHFGETPKWTSCGACDVCGSEPEWLKVPEPATRSTRRASSASTSPDTHDTPERRVRVPLKPFPAGGANRVAPLGAARPDDQELRDYLREWRRSIAKEQGMPAYVVMHDSSLDELCRVRPRTPAELRSITGFGERKVELYGNLLLAALAQFTAGSRAAVMPQEAISPEAETLRLLGEGHSLAEIARRRGRQLGTIIGAVASLVEQGTVQFQEDWVSPEKRRQIEEACDRLGVEKLKPLKDARYPRTSPMRRFGYWWPGFARRIGAARNLPLPETAAYRLRFSLRQIPPGPVRRKMPGADAGPLPAHLLLPPRT
jgi:ATP-dependent DNA helicase RecQ